MVAAKNDRAHRALSKQFADKLESELQRGYLAVVWGAPLRSNGIIDAALDRNPHSREKRSVREGGRHAVTHWELRETFMAPDDIKLGKNASRNAGKKSAEVPGGKAIASLIACMLETGRTHQIRVHLAHIGHPIMGDETYATGFKSKAGQLGPLAKTALNALGRQALHAAVLGFTHPATGEFLRFEAALPADIQALVERLRAKT
jgi:23S rRNA pseudouridine1911/1915/1917 synthase